MGRKLDLDTPTTEWQNVTMPLTAHDLLNQLQQLPPDELNLPVTIVAEGGFIVENLDCVSVGRLPGKQYGPTGGPYAVILDGE